MAVTVGQLEKALDNRCMFDVSSLEGVADEEESDMYLYPDLSTFEIFPWRPQQGKVARLICDVYKKMEHRMKEIRVMYSERLLRRRKRWDIR